MEAVDRDGRHPVTITDAPVAHSDEMSGRVRRYLWSMLVRTICFVAAVVTDGPLRWAFIVAAVFLPYIAVILANAAGRKTQTTFDPHVVGARGELPAGDRLSTDDRRGGATSTGT